MKQPTPLTSIFGSKAGFMATAVCGSLVIVLWMTGQASGMAAAIAAGVMAGACKAWREVQAYKAWQREWNALAGTPQVKRKGNWPALAWVFLLALVVIEPVPDPTFRGLIVLAFLLMTLVLVIKLVWKIARRFRGVRASAAPKRDHVVQVCLPVARSSPSLSQVTAALPGYCKQLLRNSSKE